MSTEVKWRRIDKHERRASAYHANLAVIHSYEDGWQTIAHQKPRHGHTGPMIKSSLSEGHKTGAAAQRWIEQWAADTGMI